MVNRGSEGKERDEESGVSQLGVSTSSDKSETCYPNDNRTGTYLSLPFFPTLIPILLQSHCSSSRKVIPDYRDQIALALVKVGGTGRYVGV
ncbi:hypothetical protein M0804_009817 [Polistes exclamans]|nr:hypothetical protein M0804_009817 [Polistes exclamans]